MPGEHSPWSVESHTPCPFVSLSLKSLQEVAIEGMQYFPVGTSKYHYTLVNSGGWWNCNALLWCSFLGIFECFWELYIIYIYPTVQLSNIYLFLFPIMSLCGEPIFLSHLLNHKIKRQLDLRAFCILKGHINIPKKPVVVLYLITSQNTSPMKRDAFKYILSFSFFVWQNYERTWSIS